MILEDFIKTVRDDIAAKKYTVKKVVAYLERNGWFTTKDVPSYKRVSVLKDLRNDS